MKISTKSWHYRVGKLVWRWDPYWDKPPNNLCKYFWAVFFAFIFLIAVTTFFGFSGLSVLFAKVPGKAIVILSLRTSHCPFLWAPCASFLWLVWKLKRNPERPRGAQKLRKLRRATCEGPQRLPPKPVTVDEKCRGSRREGNCCKGNLWKGNYCKITVVRLLLGPVWGYYWLFLK